MLTLVSALLLTACSDDSEQADKPQVTFEAIPCSQTFVQVEPMSFTRAWTPPSGYVSYSALNSLFVNQTDLVDNTISIFFTQDGQTPVQGKFQKNGNQWRTSMDKDDIKVETYYLYGFIPFISSVEPSIAPDVTTNHYSDGAVLTLSNLPSITPNDVCVIVGAKNGRTDYRENEDYSVSGLVPGNFAYAAQAAGAGGGGNYIYLLFDHLYSAMQFRFRVESDYAALRTIKLKKLELQGYNEDDETPVLMSRNVNATITLKANNTGRSPIVGDVVFTPTSTDMDAVLICDKEDDPVELPSGYDNQYNKLYSDFFGSFVPGAISTFKLKSTYDVYDRKGNLVRNNCTAENTLRISDLYGHQDETIRGFKYVINITIQPTYLYVLSEPDLDNPTAVVSN